jgi:hypothetical protein
MSPRNVTIQALTMAIFLTSMPAAAAKKNERAAMVPAKTSNLKLSTDIHFDGVNVNGRRQAPFGASAVVENEKQTPNLIDYRSSYEDRITRSKSGR